MAEVDTETDTAPIPDAAPDSPPAAPLDVTPPVLSITRPDVAPPPDIPSRS